MAIASAVKGEDYREFGARLKELRRARGYRTQAQLGAAVGVSRDLISDLERGYRWREPSWNLIEKVAAHFGYRLSPAGKGMVRSILPAGPSAGVPAPTGGAPPPVAPQAGIPSGNVAGEPPVPIPHTDGTLTPHDYDDPLVHLSEGASMFVDVLGAAADYVVDQGADTNGTLPVLIAYLSAVGLAFRARGWPTREIKTLTDRLKKRQKEER